MRSQPTDLATSNIGMEKSKSDQSSSLSSSSSDSTGGLKLNSSVEDIKVIRRNGSVVTFEASKIAVAMTKAFLAVNGGQGAASARVREQTELFTSQIAEVLLRRLPAGGSVHIEEIQDQVELALMRAGEHEVARAYVLYREKRSKERQQKDPDSNAQETDQLKITIDNKLHIFDKNFFLQIVNEACKNYEEFVDPNDILKEAFKNIYDGISFEEVFKSIILSARTLIEKDPAYAKVSAQLLLYSIRKEVLGFNVEPSKIQTVYEEYFSRFIKEGVEKNLLDPELLNFNLTKLAPKLCAYRDNQFHYLGIQTLYDRYFIVDKKDKSFKEGRRLELPQIFFMRVAMGLAIKEVDRESKAIEFYDLLSSFDFMSSTPTLFNSGTQFSQLSSCYLSTVDDDLSGIYEAIKENALLAKYAGGLGNDWTPVRAMGSYIKGTNGQSQGVVPFLKVVNDTAVAVNQGGKRKGAVCTYLETWHLDIEEFLELRKNTGDDRRRTHDMNTSNWIPDLFMKRVHEDKQWTLFSPDTVPDLHEKVGQEFEVAYCNYEKLATKGELSPCKEISAVALWRKMLSMLYETGHPWITFKDPCNIRNPQQHVGVVHSSNLCTEITLNTSNSEIAVCNLGSVNLVNHLIQNKEGKLDLNIDRLQNTVKTAMRMLDNVIDINYYAVGKARNSNLRHRPVGLGIMGFQDSLHAMRISYASSEAVNFADRSMETICYMAYSASSDLAEERGSYSSFKGSLWDQGILPLDTLQLLEKQRGEKVEIDRSKTLDWDALRERIKKNGIRNSNCVAIAPTATISNIVGVSASIEPTFQNLYVKSNLSGEFTIVSETMVRDLKKLGLWDEVMVSDLKYFDGSLAKIDRVPKEVRNIYATAFEVDPKWIVECAARRQKWIDQAQSLNIYMSGVSGKKLDEVYKLAWKRGLKTTYYLRTIGATHAEKSTANSGELNSVETNKSSVTSFCTLDDPECEACQ